MTAQTQLDAYLDAFRRRLKSLIVARGAAIAAIGALLVTLVAVYLGTRRAFDPQFVIGARIILLLILAAVVLGLLVYPLRVLRRSGGIEEIERRGPEFEGRIETYDGLSRAEPGKRSPFLGLLAEDALKLAQRIPIRLRVPAWQISAPAAVAILAAGALIWFAAYGPNNWRYGVRNLWAGWFLSNTLPPQRINVTPGDGVVRRGGDLDITAQARGFDPATMEVFAEFGSEAGWQRAKMKGGTARDSFGFTFYAVRKPLKYYVSAAGVRSREYKVAVADVPEVKNLKLSYKYPDWSGLAPRVENPGSDISAVAGTEVTVAVRTDEPLESPALVANGTPIKMQTHGDVSTATLKLSKQGHYYVSTQFNKSDVKLTDDYQITVVPDEAPVVKVVRPGRDWHATNIEEVPVSVQAKDDFGLKKVELHYSINGGKWQTMPLNVEGKQGTGTKTLYLENMRAPKDAAADSTADRLPTTLEDLRRLRARKNRSSGAAQSAQDAGGAKSTERHLQPGDLISYYAAADDRSHSVQSDMYFIEVEPFDRSYTQSTQSGGGGGGGGSQQNQISKREKEILVATWNLIKERGEGKSSYLDKQQFQDNAQMLSQLQSTLSDQATSLADRTQARQLTSNDQRIRRFVRYLKQASDAMKPAADRLANLKLSDAVPPEQKSLQYLLRAESVFRDIQVSFQRNGGAGGGGLASRDLSDLFQMEMDLDKNQYETQSPLSFNKSPQAQTDKAIQKLQELARRQEELAQRVGNRRLTEQERWQQDKLRRDAEKLKRQLQQLQQQMASSGQQGRQSQQGQQGQQGQPGQQGQQSQAAQGGQAGSSGQIGATIQQLDRALQAMNRAGATGQQASPEQTQQAIDQARRQLQQALQQMTAQRRAAAGQAFSDLANRSDKLYREQRQVSAELQQAVERQANGNQTDQRSGQGGDDQLEQLAERKDQLESELEGLQKDMSRVAKQFQTQTPGASKQLDKSLADLQTSQAAARLRYAAEGIREGAATEVAATDAVTTSALRDLQRGTAEAQALAKQEAVAGAQSKPDPNAELVAELQALRQRLAQAQRGGQAGAAPQYAANGSQRAAAPGSGAQRAGGARSGARQGGAGGGGGGFYDPNRAGVWNPGTAGIWQNRQAVKQLSDQLGAAGNQLLTLANRNDTQNLTPDDIRAIRQLARKLRAGLNDGLNAATLDRESQALADLVDKVELQLRKGQSTQKEVAAARTAEPAQVAKGFQDLVAEYFRRLGRTKPDKSAP